MGKISLKEMNDYKTEGTESNSNHNDGFKNDAERDDDIKELELMEKYERLGDLVLTSLHGNFECTIDPKRNIYGKARK